MKKLEVISTRQAASRVRVKKLPAHCDGGIVSCACHLQRLIPNKFASARGFGQTESVTGFWSKGDKVFCAKSRRWCPAIAIFPKLGIIIDTRI